MKCGGYGEAQHTGYSVIGIAQSQDGTIGRVIECDPEKPTILPPGAVPCVPESTGAPTTRYFIPDPPATPKASSSDNGLQRNANRFSSASTYTKTADGGVGLGAGGPSEPAVSLPADSTPPRPHEITDDPRKPTVTVKGGNYTYFYESGREITLNAKGETVSDLSGAQVELRKAKDAVDQANAEKNSAKNPVDIEKANKALAAAQAKVKVAEKNVAEENRIAAGGDSIEIKNSEQTYRKRDGTTETRKVPDGDAVYARLRKYSWFNDNIVPAVQKLAARALAAEKAKDGNDVTINERDARAYLMASPFWNKEPTSVPEGVGPAKIRFEKTPDAGTLEVSAADILQQLEGYGWFISRCPNADVRRAAAEDIIKKAGPKEGSDEPVEITEAQAKAVLAKYGWLMPEDPSDGATDKKPAGTGGSGHSVARAAKPRVFKW